VILDNSGNSKPVSIQSLKVEWKSLLKAGKPSEAEAFYWRDLAPLVQARLEERTRSRVESGDLPKYDSLVMPLSVECVRQYVLMINVLKPRKLVFLVTRETDVVLSEIISRCNLSPLSYKKIYFDYNSLDLAKAYSSVKEALSSYPGRVAVDLTSGKRVMTASAGVVGAFYDCDLLYVNDSWLPDLKTGDPGTEEIAYLSNPYSLFGDLEESRAIELFNAHDYASACTLLDSLKERVRDPREVETTALLSGGYLKWDSFDFHGARNSLSESLGKARQYDVFPPETIASLDSNLQALSVLCKTAHSGNSIEFLSQPELVSHLVIDLLCNAERRAQQNRFEDATVRVYRALELIAHHRLAARGINPYNVELSREDEEKVSSNFFRIFGEEKHLQKEIRMFEAHFLLYSIGDRLWEGKGDASMKALYEMAAKRWKLLLAHGTDSVPKGLYARLRAITLDFSTRVCRINSLDCRKIYSAHSFVKLKTNGKNGNHSNA
jgi:CRISPR-associated protein (TIGR02710 family)